MANLLSPGVQVVEKDLTQIVPKVSTSRGAVAGRFNWGPIQDPQLVTSEAELTKSFGKPDDNNYTSFFTAANFLGYSNSLYVTRADSVNQKNAVVAATSGIDSITVTAAGSGYTDVPVVTISAPTAANGVQAVAEAVLIGGGLVTTTDGSNNTILNTSLLINGGDGDPAFSVGMKVVFSDPDETFDTIDDNGVLTSVLVPAEGEVLTVSGNSITSIKITNPGKGYTKTASIIAITDTDGNVIEEAPFADSGFVHDPIPVVAGGVKRIDVLVNGSGYTTNPTISIDGYGSGATATAVRGFVGIKIKNQTHYDQDYSTGQGTSGIVAAKWAGSIGNSLLFSMADAASYDATLSGIFNTRTKLEKFENKVELTKARRVKPGHAATQPVYSSSQVSNFTDTSAALAGKVLRTSTTNTRRSGAKGGLVPYTNILVGKVASYSPQTIVKITLAKACPALTSFTSAKMQGQAIGLSKPGTTIATIGTFDGYAKTWNNAADAYVIDNQSFYMRRTYSGAYNIAIGDVLSCAALANALTVNANKMVAGTKYKIKTVGTTNYTLYGAANNNVGTEFTATKAGVGTGTVYSTNILGAVSKVELVDMMILNGNAANEVQEGVCDNEWEYRSEFKNKPATSDWAAKNNSANDEVHMILVDAGGKITGTAGTILQKWEGASKASDAKSANGTSLYYKDLLNNSEWLWWLDHPEVTDTTTPVNGRAMSDWGRAAKDVHFQDIDNTQPAGKNPVLGLRLQGGDDGDALTNADIMNAYEPYQDKVAYDISLVATGDVDSTVATWIVENIAAQRTDCVAFLSAPLLIGSASDIATQMVDYRNEIDIGDVTASYAVMDSGWKYQYDRYNDKFRWVPLNGDIAGVCAHTDNVSDAWFSPGGFSRGQIKNVTKLAYNPNNAQRDVLYAAGINPVVTFPGEGTILYGDKTMQKKASAFDRINVRRLFIVLEKAIANAAKYQLFEFNDEFTRAQFKNLVEPFLRDVQGRRGIVDFRVRCDTSNNTPQVIDSNEFVADIFIKPNRSINYITLNFIATKTGISFDTVGL